MSLGVPSILARVAAAAVLTAALGWSCAAQTQDPGTRDPGSKWVHPPDSIPKPPAGDKTRNLDFLFEALKIAPDDDSAKAIENRIWALWATAGGDTGNLLMSRAKKAIDGKDIDLAIRLLNATIEVRPDFVEAWNRRATMYYLKKDFGDAMADIRHVLSVEPRHFGALAGLGTILEEVGDEKHALEAYRKALAVHPHLKGIAEHVKELADKIEGRDI
jgi:tetratricopeptide (TPR) repeat protein